MHVNKAKDLPFGSSVDDQDSLVFQSGLHMFCQHLFPYLDGMIKKNTHKVQVTLVPGQFGFQIIEALAGNVCWDGFVTELGSDAVEKGHAESMRDVEICSLNM